MHMFILSIAVFSKSEHFTRWAPQIDESILCVISTHLFDVFAKIDYVSSVKSNNRKQFNIFNKTCLDSYIKILKKNAEFRWKGHNSICVVLVHTAQIQLLRFLYENENAINYIFYVKIIPISYVSF